MRRGMLWIGLAGSVGLVGCGQGAGDDAAPSGPARGNTAGATGAAGVALAYPELAQAPAEKGTRRSETVRSTEGVVVGLPAGWRTADASGGADYNPENGNAMGNCLFITHPARNNTTTCAVRMDTLPGMKGKGLGAKTLERYAFIARFDGAEWEEWKPAVVGAKRFPAKIAHARSGVREGIAAWVEVPGKKPVLVVGSWGDAGEKSAVFDILRGIDAGS